MMRGVALLLCLVAAAAAQGTYGSPTNSVNLKNGTSFGASRANVPNFLTAEDRRFTVALNWLRQDPARWKSFMTAQGRWDIQEPFLVVGNDLKPNLALHYNPNIAAASHWHAWEMAVMSPTASLTYFFPDHCPDPKKWPGTPCSPPDKYTPPGSNVPVDVECFRREGCFNPTIDYYNRMDEFGTPIFPAPGSRIAGGNFYAGGTIYTSDVERGVTAAMSIACDSPDPEQPFNCTADSFGGGLDTGKEILYKPIGLRIHGAAYYAQASKKVNYFDTYFAAGPAPDTQNPIASAVLLRVNGAGYFVLNYREPNADFAAPRQVGVLYSISGAVTQTALSHNPSAALVYTADASSILALCTGTTPPSIPYAFFAVDSNGNTYRYPENNNLDACAGGAAGSVDIVSDPGNGGVTNGVVNFQGTTQTPPPGANPDLVPTVTFGSFAASVLPAVALLLAAAFAVLAL